uniref:P-type ATPase C-terminal domain-containing protein n=1 Tax=Oryzias latipes TaxID=8090 RepID=A0A3B3IL66_ORYLA
VDCFLIPKLYTQGQLNHHSNWISFLFCVMQSMYYSIIVFFIPYGALYDTVRQDGREIADYQSFALFVQTCLIIVMNAQVRNSDTTSTKNWTWLNHIFLWGITLLLVMSVYSPLFFKLSLFFLSGTARNCLSQFYIWLGIFLSCLLCILPVIFLHAQTKMNRDGEPLVVPCCQVTSARRRSSYAFSHSPGYGDLVTSKQFLGMKIDRYPLISVES